MQKGPVLIWDFKIIWNYSLIPLWVKNFRKFSGKICRVAKHPDLTLTFLFCGRRVQSGYFDPPNGNSVHV